MLRPGGALVVSTQHPTTDWLRKGGSYFDVKLETDVWHTQSGDQPVRFWREPLSALCGYGTGAGFLIEKSSSLFRQTQCASVIRRITRS